MPWTRARRPVGSALHRVEEHARALAWGLGQAPGLLSDIAAKVLGNADSGTKQQQQLPQLPVWIVRVENIRAVAVAI